MKKLLILTLILALNISLFAQYNRNDYESQVDTRLTTLVTIAKLKALHKDDLALSAVFRTDVISATTTPTGDAISLDFTDYDQHVVDGVTNDIEPSFTLSNIANGEIVSIKLTKNANRRVQFSNATDITPNSDDVDDNATAITYLIIRKGSANYAWGLRETVKTATETNSGILEVATTTEAQAGTADDKIITPDKLQDVTSTTTRKGVIEIATTTEVRAGTAGSLAVIASDLSNSEAFSSLTLLNGWNGSLLIKKDNLGNVYLFGTLYKDAGTTSSTVANIAAAYQPSTYSITDVELTDDFISAAEERKVADIKVSSIFRVYNYTKIDNNENIYINMCIPKGL